MRGEGRREEGREWMEGERKGEESGKGRWERMGGEGGAGERGGEDREGRGKGRFDLIC